MVRGMEKRDLKIEYFTLTESFFSLSHTHPYSIHRMLMMMVAAEKGRWKIHTYTH